LEKKIKTFEEKRIELERILSREAKLKKFEEELAEKAKKLEEDKLNSENILNEKLLALEEKQKKLDETRLSVLESKISEDNERMNLETEFRKKTEEIESKQSKISETMRLQMEALAKKEKELAYRESEIEKEKGFSEQLLKQEVKAIVKREKELEEEKQKLSAEKVIAEKNIRKEQMDELPGIDQEINNIIEDQSSASDIFIHGMISGDEKDVKDKESKPGKIWLLPDFVIERDPIKNFHYFVHEFIVVVFVNLSRCTSINAVEFKEFITKIEKLNARKIIIDLTFAEFIDSTFLGVLVSFLKRLRRDDRELSVILDMTKMTSTTFLLSGLDRVFNLAQDLETAFDEFFNP